MARRGHERAEEAAAAAAVDDEVILETIFAKPTGWLLPHPVPLAHGRLLEDEWSDQDRSADLYANQNTRRVNYPALLPVTGHTGRHPIVVVSASSGGVAIFCRQVGRRSPRSRP